MSNLDYKVDITIKNNRIYQRIIDMGFGSIRQFCINYELSAERIGSLVRMWSSPFIRGANGSQWSATVLRLCEIFNCEPEDLITEEQSKIVKNKKIELYANQQQLMNALGCNEKYKSLEYIDDEIEAEQLSKKLLSQLDTLSPREIKVIRMKFGINNSKEQTYDEIGKYFDISRERVRKIEQKSLRKLRHPGRTDKL
jgi:RNA polymerase sigma factor (sigma-70 family)